MVVEVRLLGSAVLKSRELRAISVSVPTPPGAGLLEPVNWRPDYSPDSLEVRFRARTVFERDPPGLRLYLSEEGPIAFFRE
jgi:hypothetical protein